MNRHIPIRSCAICRVRFPKQELIRFAPGQAAEASKYVRDDKQALPGRGIYLCSDKTCIERGKTKLGITVEE